MNAAELIEELQERGVRLTADGDRLRFRGPREVLTEARLSQLRERKPEVLQLLVVSCQLPKQAHASWAVLLVKQLRLLPPQPHSLPRPPNVVEPEQVRMRPLKI